MTAIEDRYELGMGQLSVDLRDVDFPAGDHVVELELGVGEARVLVPEEVCVSVDADLGAGWAELHGEGAGGIDVELSEQRPGPAGVPRVKIEADVGVGELWIGSYSGPFGEFDRHGFPLRPRPPLEEPASGGDSCA